MLRFSACLSVLLLSAGVLADNSEWPLPVERVPLLEAETPLAVEAELLPTPKALPALEGPWVTDEMTTYPAPTKHDWVAPTPHGAPVRPTRDDVWVAPEPLDVLSLLGPPIEFHREVKATSTPTHRLLSEFWGYRVSEQSLSWTIGQGDQLGSFSFDPNPYLLSGLHSGIHGGLGMRFLSGPHRTDMPPRVYDISWGIQQREVLGDLTYDVSASVLVATDFIGSSRQGVRFPSHAVGYVEISDGIELVFGVDFLDRDDVRILPVGGLLLRPDPDVRIELIFPCPRVELQLTEDYRLYFRGGLGGGTWAVERDTKLNDAASLFELEYGTGLVKRTTEGDWWGAEVIVLFDRRLEYTSGVGNYRPDSTVMLRYLTQY